MNCLKGRIDSRRGLNTVSHFFCVAGLVCLLALNVTPLPAATIITGDVTPPLPWDATTNARIGDAGNGILTVDEGDHLASYVAGLGWASGSIGEATVSGSGSQWTNSGEWALGVYGSGTLRVEAGGQVNFGGRHSLGYVAVNSGSMGLATITGVGSQWNYGEFLRLGHWGSGELRVEAGGQVNGSDVYLPYLDGATGVATVTGFGSQWNNSYLSIGNRGSGLLRVEAGGIVTSESADIVLNPNGGTGAAIVTGSGSLWNNSGRLSISRTGGNGTLTVEDGGEVITGTLYASLDDLFGDGTINASGAVLDADLRFDATHATQQQFAFGAGGTLTVAPNSGGRLGAGFNGDGSLTIADGVAISSLDGVLALQPSATGEALVTGPGSQWNNSGGLYIAPLGGRGTLDITFGGLVTVGGTLSVDQYSHGDSYIDMAAGGMLVLRGQANGSLSEYLDLIEGTDAIRYWNASLPGWAPITAATYGDDYTLEYLTTGDLAGYTVLTVFTPIPEPSAWMLMVLFALAMMCHYRLVSAKCGS